MDSPVIATGYASTCRLTAKEMIARKWEVYAVAFNGGNIGEAPIDWYGVTILPNYALKRDPNAIYGDAATVVQIFNEIKPDILFFHNDSYRYAYLESLPKEILDRSVFWLPFEGDSPDALGVRLFNKCSATRFVTKHALRIHADSLKENDIGVIHHAIDIENYSPASDKRAAKLDTQLSIENKFVVSRVDRHQPRKYWTLTLEAFARFANGKDDVVLLAKCNPRDCVMWNSEKKEGIDLEKIAADLGIASKVKFNDYFFNAPFMAKGYYKCADVFLTTTSGEGFGLPVAEAMASAVPVICPETPVLPEIAAGGAMFCKLKGREYYNAMNVWHNLVDIDDVVEKLEFAYKDWKSGGKELAKIGSKGREAALAKFSPKSVYDEWNAVFKSVMQKRELVSIITVLYNVSGDEQIYGEDGIEKFKASVEKYVKHPYEWIIVDNGSPEREKTRQWLASATSSNPHIKPILIDENLGFAGANNAAMSMAKGAWIIFSNPDSEALDPAKLNLPADFVKMMVDKAKSDPNIGIVGMENNRRDDILPGSIFPYFCNVLMTRKCLDAIKMEDGKWFDEGFWPAYYEDAAICFRAMGKGFKSVEHNIPFWHKSGGTNKHAIEGGAKGPVAKKLGESLERLAIQKATMADWGRKRGELAANGMQGLIEGNIAYLNSKYGREARQKIKVVFHTHIGAAVGFSEIVEGIVPELHRLGFDLYINDWSNGSNIQDPLIRDLYQKYRKSYEESDELDDAIHIVAWLMETFYQCDAAYRVGLSFCESTRVRPSYLQACNSMDRILTCSDFCRNVQKNSGYTSPIHVIPPGVHPAFLNYYQRPIKKDKFTFLTVGVSQDRKDTYRLVQAFCEAFPKNASYFPECEPGIELKPGQVELVLKSNNFGELSWVHSQGFSNVANIRTIFTGDDPRADRKNLSRQEMYDLYCEADCLVHPSHGEGVGYPLLEGAATGLPVIFTNWSAPAEYFDESNSYPCSLGPNGTDMIDAYNGHGGQPGENGKWANVHIGHLKHLMRHVIRNRADAAKIGRQAAEHVKKKFNWEESARYLVPMLFEWDEDRKKKCGGNRFDPLTFQRPKLDPVQEGDRVLIDIVTRDRHSYLCSLLVSLLGQTFRNWDVIIQCDDADDSMPNDFQIMSILARCSNDNHNWRLIRSHRQGPHIAHDRTLQMAKDDPNHKYKLICRIDDDIYVKPDYLEKLFQAFLEDKEGEVGAVAGVYLDPKRPDKEQVAPAGWETDIHYAGKIEPNEMWPYVCLYPEGTKRRPVEHLYSSFMFRAEAAVAIGGYCKRYSQIGHREESDFSYRFHLAGWKMLIEPKAVGFHFYAPSGGIRANGIADKQALAEGDHRIYERRLRDWRKRAELRKQQDAEATRLAAPVAKKLAEAQPAYDQLFGKPTEKSPVGGNHFPDVGKMVTVINAGHDLSRLKESIERHSSYSDEIYVTCENESAKTVLAGMEKVKMVATAPDETAMLAKSILADGDHEFIMTIPHTLKFEGDPSALLRDDYDDYVFETYTTYVPCRKAGNAAVFEKGLSETVGPELRNQCLITRRRAGAQPLMERILYADMIAIDDALLMPVAGKSTMGNDLIPVAEMDERPWRKVCVYQYPKGRLDAPWYKDVSPKSKAVSIIIPTAGRLKLLKQCIDSIYSHTSTPFEIVVVDGGSQDGTEEYLKNEAKSRPGIVHVRLPENVGYQKAANIGIQKSKGRFVLLFNDDAWVEARQPDGRDWLQTYVDELEGDPKLGIVGPHGGDSPALGNRILYFWCVMFRRPLYDEIGPLDDITFRNYGGDDDYCVRVKNAGYSIKEKPTKLRHLMTCVPEHVKKPELAESVIKLRAKHRR
jgi:GT2 family glycosyltransferase